MESDNSIPVMVVKEKQRGAIMTRVASLRNSRKLILIMVSIGLLLDNMLLTVVGSYYFFKYKYIKFFLYIDSF